MPKSFLYQTWRLYYDGFKNMTLGRTLWALILLKVIILFAVLKVFFFKSAMAGKTKEQKSEFVGKVLRNEVAPNEESAEQLNQKIIKKLQQN